MSVELSGLNMVFDAKRVAREAESAFWSQFNGYLSSLAATQDSVQFRKLFKAIPLARGYRPEGACIEWKMFERSSHYGPAEQRCMQMLKEIGFEYWKCQFDLNMIWHYNLSIVQGFCEEFEVDPGLPRPDGGSPLLTLSVEGIHAARVEKRPAAVAVYRWLLEKATTVDAVGFAPCDSTALAEIIGLTSDVPDDLVLALAQETLDKGANPNVEENVRGWQQPDGGERLPLLHALYADKARNQKRASLNGSDAGAGSAKRIAWLEAHCNTRAVDHRGLTARQYYELLTHLESINVTYVGGRLHEETTRYLARGA